VATVAYQFNGSALRVTAIEREALLKRSLDVVGSVSALVLVAPLLVAVGLIIWLCDAGPVVYSQERIGRNGRTFRCLKFRTMAMNAEKIFDELLANDALARMEWETIHKLRRDPRVTRLGKFLRMSSLDELPQLFNVLKGDMSLVGPRPIVSAEAGRYGRRFRSYCMVKPGLTGLWQISGRNNTSYRRRVAFDVTYVRRASLSLDLWIILRTVPAIVSASGSY
jgi:lipopolysaccharide/colanic/teichoic acid biosynthesis glycosyltransferase